MDVEVKLLREEALACIIALQKEKPYGWQQDALAKLNKAMKGERDAESS